MMLMVPLAVVSTSIENSALTAPLSDKETAALVQDFVAFCRCDVLVTYHVFVCTYVSDPLVRF